MAMAALCRLLYSMDLGWRIEAWELVGRSTNGKNLMRNAAEHCPGLHRNQNTIISHLLVRWKRATVCGKLYFPPQGTNALLLVPSENSPVLFPIGPQCTQWDGHSCWFMRVRGSCKYECGAFVHEGLTLSRCRMNNSHAPGRVAETSSSFRQRVCQAWRHHAEHPPVEEYQEPPGYVLNGQHAQGILLQPLDLGDPLIDWRVLHPRDVLWIMMHDN